MLADRRDRGRGRCPTCRAERSFAEFFVLELALTRPVILTEASEVEEPCAKRADMSCGSFLGCGGQAGIRCPDEAKERPFRSLSTGSFHFARGSRSGRDDRGVLHLFSWRHV